MPGPGCNVEGFAASNRRTYPHHKRLGMSIRAKPKLKQANVGCQVCYNHKQTENLVGGCGGTQFGCCDDGYTAKVDVSGTNCQQEPIIGGCAGTIFGCCPDNVTPQTDPFGSNCESSPVIGGCVGTQFGCCPDGSTAKVDMVGSNCGSSPIIGPCSGTEFGCCGDGTTPRQNYLGTNCPDFCPQCRKPRKIEGTNCYVICPKGEDIDSGELEKRLNRAVLNMADIQKI